MAKYGTVLDIDVADLDSDGDKDTVINRTGDGTNGVGFYQGYYVQVLFNDGSEDFTNVSTDVLPTGNISTGGWFDWIRLQDFDGDSVGNFQ